MKIAVIWMLSNTQIHDNFIVKKNELIELLFGYEFNCIINVQSLPLRCFYSIVHSFSASSYDCYSLLPTIQLNPHVIYAPHISKIQLVIALIEPPMRE